MSFKLSNLPEWLENNPVFRKLFLLRKLYLTRSKFGYFSAYAEDVSINRCFPNKSSGFFVDAGCFHPKKYNNTWRLYKKGWRGINIDIDSIKVEGFDIVRPQDTNINCAVSNIEGEITFYSRGFYSLMSSLDKTFTEGKSGYTQKRYRLQNSPI
ncbi:MAG: hypothetical protein ACI9H8_001005 [Lysobacterales bacterium]|jgi:hypothetical protein